MPFINFLYWANISLEQSSHCKIVDKTAPETYASIPHGAPWLNPDDKRRPEMFNLLPKEQIFFDLFEQAASNVHKGAVKLVGLMNDFTDLETKAKEIKDIEHAGDQITHKMIERLNKTFITPLDREDIHELTGRLDDILDFIDTAGNRIMLYKLDKPTKDAQALADIIEKTTAIIEKMIPGLRKLSSNREVEALMKSCIDVYDCETEGDRIEQHALAALFNNGHDPKVASSQRNVSGDVCLKLYKGAVHVLGRRSPHSLYSEALATFEADAGAYDQADAGGFIRLQGLRLRP